MAPSLQPLLDRLEHLTDSFRELRDGVRRAIHIADADPEMALTRSRKVLEYVIREVYERRIGEPPGTRPLENLMQRLVKDGHFPDRLDAYATTIRKLGNVGTHTFGEKVTAGDVYQSLAQLMPILEWYFEVERPDALAVRPVQAPSKREAARSSPAPAASAPKPALAVVPKGLRSFDAHDASFFLDLLPGARDKDGLPESVRFWKHRIEGGDEQTFTIGVIYGPSGCGKSSLVKAGLLPRLAHHVLPVYVEATADDTEARLLKGLRKRLPNLPTDRDLVATLTALRQGIGLGAGQKVLLVLDQFEQWLHARRQEENTPLAQALRQCDGEYVQCVVLVRDDFWLALSRFTGDLHLELVQGQNLALVDLFDLLHARTVLAAFGRAFGRLHDNSREEELFLDRAIQELAQDGRVISVRLALFAEMVKSRPWTPAALKAVGGTAGVGEAFLEETFRSSRASPKNHLHQKAARAVLQALLPEQGSDIKGNMRSHAELLAASGYANRPADFDDLLRILDGELRLVTPTEPGAVDAENRPEPHGGGKYFQLTHDYLVPSLREWLVRKQKETRRGRAELRLADRAAAWVAKPETRNLPGWWEWANITLFTRKRGWTPAQRTMMRRTTRYHLLRAFVFVLLLSAVGLAGLDIRNRGIEQNKRTHAAGLVQRLLDADTAQVPGIVNEMRDYRQWTDPLLREKEKETERDSRARLRISLALLPVDRTQVLFLYRCLFHAEPAELLLIRNALEAHRDDLVEQLWDFTLDTKHEKEERFRAACVLAAYDPTGRGAGRADWPKIAPFVAEQMLAVVQENPAYYSVILELLRPLQSQLVAPLAQAGRDAGRPESVRLLATNFLISYAGQDSTLSTLLTDLLLDTEEKHFQLLFSNLRNNQNLDVALFRKSVALTLESTKNEEDKDKLARRQANAAAALLKLNEKEAVWPLFKHGPDPRVRSYLIHRLAPLQVHYSVIASRLFEEKDVSSCRALLLAWGEYPVNDFIAPEEEKVRSRVWWLYRDHPDPGVHGAAEWVLRQWHEQDKLTESEQEWARDKTSRERRLAAIVKELANAKTRGDGYWYVNAERQTMVVIPQPEKGFLMGSPATEKGREGGAEGTFEKQHEKQIGRSYAIAAKEVTVEQFQRFRRAHVYNKEFARGPNYPVNMASWNLAAEYCNWLTIQDGIDPDQCCYDTSKGVALKKNYLDLKGYRLPSEAEWEYACRSGTTTSRYFGPPETLLGKYAWYSRVSGDEAMLPVGSLKPNDLGLFDMLGNAAEWCQDGFGDNYYLPVDKEDTSDLEKILRVTRGGAFVDNAWILRSAYRDRWPAASVSDYFGFRPARTIR